jgi:3-oxoadipate enol-lactonase
MPYRPIRDIDIWFDQAGTGTPLLAISGSRGDLRRKPNLLGSPLAQSFDVLAYDQRGLGRTSKPDKPYPMADFADDAAALLDAVGWERVPVVGVSFGGMVALELALRHPHRVARLVLCCTSPGGEGGSSYPVHLLRNLPHDERARIMVSVSDTRCDAGWAKENPRKLEELVRRFGDDQFAEEPGHQIGTSRLLEARRQHDSWERLAQIRCPVLVCGGRYDGIALPSSQEHMVGRIPGAILRMFEGGHLFLWQDGSAFVEILRFLANEDVHIWPQGNHFRILGPRSETG